MLLKPATAGDCPDIWWDCSVTYDFFFSFFFFGCRVAG
uniref:Uncharacterized protein n=1 Tax=Rhizophora mucronata TaxID=61149 RepID=A0A2P2NF77_RHIMU